MFGISKQLQPLSVVTLKGSPHLFFFFKLYLFILREGSSVSGGGAERERERERERIPNRLHAVSAELDVGLDPVNREIMT